MPFLKRLIATISGVLFLQLSLLGSGVLCATHRGHAMSPGAGAHAMNGRQAPDDCGTPSTNDSCRGPWAPGGCASMTSCAAATAAPTAGVQVLRTFAVARDLPEPLSAESELAVTPEPPPPRA